MYRKIKRLMDFILSLLALFVLAPVFLALILAIKLDTKGPILFKQKRVGKHKRHFYIYKFRSMRIDTPKDVPTHLLENPDQWITKVGRFLRKTSLDELPQIFNVLKGDMAIIGPRPALYNQDDLIAERDKYNVNALLPGITGLAQIHGRDELPIPEKVRLDALYLEMEGPVRDFLILVRTFLNAISGKGIVEGKQDQPPKE